LCNERALESKREREVTQGSKRRGRVGAVQQSNEDEEGNTRQKTGARRRLPEQTKIPPKPALIGWLLILPLARFASNSAY
jgi:hypothetical protein